MTVARSVGDVLAEHVLFEIDCIDRMYCNVYVPQLQYALGLVGYVHRQLGLPVASTAPLARITDAFDTAVHRFARDHEVPWVDFAKGKRKDDVMHEHLADSRPPKGFCSSVGRRRRPSCFAPRSAATPTAPPTRGSWPLPGWSTTSTSTCVDDDFGPFFLKFCSYFPYNAKLCLNGHEWAKRQAAKAGIGFTRWTTGSPRSTIRRRCRRCATARARADRRAAAQVAGDPAAPVYAADRAAGYRYDISILQAEFS